VPAAARGAALTCPRCLARVEAPAGTEHERDASADAEVWWDTRAAGVGLIVMAVLGIGGLAYFFVGPAPFPRTGTEWTLVIITAVLFVAVLAAAVLEVRKPEDPAARGLERLRGPAPHKEKRP
jgi:hypothetical protein